MVVPVFIVFVSGLKLHCNVVNEHIASADANEMVECTSK